MVLPELKPTVFQLQNTLEQWGKNVSYPKTSVKPCKRYLSARIAELILHPQNYVCNLNLQHPSCHHTLCIVHPIERAPEWPDRKGDLSPGHLLVASALSRIEPFDRSSSLTLWSDFSRSDLQRFAQDEGQNFLTFEDFRNRYICLSAYSNPI